MSEGPRLEALFGHHFHDPHRAVENLYPVSRPDRWIQVLGGNCASHCDVLRSPRP